MSKQRIGFIGTGIMGLPMAKNLLKAGFELTVFNRTKSKAAQAIAEGALWADSPGEIAQKCDVIITCVTDTPDVEAVLLGKSGVIDNARPGLICIDMSTISPAETKRISKILAKKQITLIDAPVSGGQIGAIQAKLSIMAGGPRDVFKSLIPIFEAMGKTITYCGKSGTGQLTKLANQIMGIHTVMSAAEGLAFAEKAGLDLDTTLKATAGGAAGSNSLKILGPKMIAGDMKPTFMVDLQLKDLRLVEEYAEKIKQPLPGTALVKQLLISLSAKNRGKDGIQSLIDVIRQLSSENP